MITILSTRGDKAMPLGSGGNNIKVTNKNVITAHFWLGGTY